MIPQEISSFNSWNLFKIKVCVESDSAQTGASTSTKTLAHQPSRLPSLRLMVMTI